MNVHESHHKIVEIFFFLILLNFKGSCIFFLFNRSRLPPFVFLSHCSNDYKRITSSMCIGLELTKLLRAEPTARRRREEEERGGGRRME